MTDIHADVGSNYTETSACPTRRASRPIGCCSRAAPNTSGDIEQLVIAVRTGRSPILRFRSRVDALLARLSQVPRVSRIDSPYEAQGR